MSHGMLEIRRGAVIFSPGRADEALALAAQRGAPLVAYIQLVDDDPRVERLVAHGAAGAVSVVADAYAGDESSLAEAIDFACAENRAERRAGPLRLTYLGSLGELRPARAEHGATISLAAAVVIGRSESCALCLRQGPHSDQNTVARMHTRITPIASGVKVDDLMTPNGTYVRGQRITSADAHPGDELAIAATHRIRVDGVPP